MTRALPQARICAVYTRKSSEEGLDQHFNSLDAQREACQAYVTSQTHEGWTLSRTPYDDGGFSGGTLDRPALQRLLAEIRHHRVQVVVVYKIDRLTRSLVDFTRIVEELDSHGASFVSVTQQFNTTSSMGRLTLNVLLSFAQFEREVTGERIRDKIAASKRRGLWMGGVVPLGYEPKDRSLRVIPKEAELVRTIFSRYLELRSVDELAATLRAKGIRRNQYVSRRGRMHGDGTFSRGALYHLLSNPVYLGRIRHKEVTYEGRHPAIVEQAIWDQVQAQLQSSARRTRGRRTDRSVNLLRGRIFDSQGHPMTPTYTPKANGQRYRYYMSQAVLKYGHVDTIEVPRIAGEVIDQWVMRVVREKLSASAECNVSDRIRRVVLRAKEIEIELDTPDKGSDESMAATTIRVPVNLCRRGQEVQILTCDGTPSEVASAPDPVLVRAMIRAYRWRDLLESGAAKSVESISRTEHVNASYLAKLLSLAYLAPDLTDEILSGTQPRQLMLKHIRELDIPLDWQAQRRLFAQFRG